MREVGLRMVANARRVCVGIWTVYATAACGGDPSTGDTGAGEQYQCEGFCDVCLDTPPPPDLNDCLVWRSYDGGVRYVPTEDSGVGTYDLDHNVCHDPDTGIETAESDCRDVLVDNIDATYSYDGEDYSIRTAPEYCEAALTATGSSCPLP